MRESPTEVSALPIIGTSQSLESKTTPQQGEVT